MEYIVLFMSCFLAATFIPFSSEATLVGALSFGVKTYYALIIATVANTLGSYFNYYIGHLGKLQWASKYLKIKEKKVYSFKDKISRYGSVLAFFCWLPIFGDVISLALGYFRVSFKNVWGLIFLGKFLRYIIVIYLFE